MQADYKISIIIPIYNAAPYLHRCLESVRTQTYENLEIICVDDGSTDESGVIADAYARADKRFVVVHKENGGESSARNAGLDLATGDYITFADNDDWLEPDMYRKMAERAADTGSDIVAAGFFRDTDESSERMINALPVSDKVFGREDLLSYAFKRDSYRGFTAYIWCKLFKHNLIMQDGAKLFLDESFIHGGDIVFFTKAACRVNRACHLDEALYHYYQRETSTSHSGRLDTIMDRLRAYEVIIDTLTDNGISEETVLYAKRFLAYHSMNAAKKAIELRDQNALLSAQGHMKRYKNEYVITNTEYPERIEEFLKIIKLRI